ncbi:hypothetical protein B0H17DRAFT_934706 [Mycena rosella]|uniref:Uncharacterized protein n=1 Tax=Mycena rosella TaxID=1033263 RepID=A0AAD7GJB0_MYCRO|nr:hypothetical protein B0H17DRAFT_934706 [Mycena rosella]
MCTVRCTALDIAGLPVVMSAGFIIDARLDAKILEQTLWKIVESKFPRAGARLARRNEVFEFQIPSIFDANTPPIAFTVDEYPEPYRSATRPELPMHLPDSSKATQPSIHSLPELDVYLKSSKCPTSLDGFLVPNTPVVHVHVAAFDDLTFIGFTAAHVAMDALGARTLLHAWTRLLSGDAIDTIPGMDWDATPFEAFNAGPTAVTPPRGWFEPERPSWLLRTARSLMRILWDPMDATRPKEAEQATRLVRMPKVFLEDSKREINDTLKRQGSGEWVGSSDVLTAWWFKTIYGPRSIGNSDATPVHIHLTVNVRDYRIFPGSSSLATPYINNAFLTIPVPPIPASAFRADSLADLALCIRRAITKYNADLDGIDADLRWRCANPLKPLLPCPRGGQFAIQANWRKAHFEALDFSGACGRNAPVIFVLEETTVMGKRMPVHGSGVVLMEDEDAVWMSQGGGVKDWENIRRSGDVTFS